MASYGSDLYGGDYFIIPQYASDREAALNADRKCREYVKKFFRISITNDWEATTITTRYVESMATIVSKMSKDNMGKQVIFDFYGVMTMSTSFSKNNKAEKTGSLNLVLHPGPTVDSIIGDAEHIWDDFVEPMPPAEYFLTDDLPEEQKKIIESIDRVARLVCSSTHKITIPDNIPAMATAIAYVYLICLIQELIYKIAASDDITELINFNECFDLNAMKDSNGGITVTINNGMEGKLTGKGDNVSEIEELEEDED